MLEDVIEIPLLLAMMNRLHSLTRTVLVTVLNVSSWPKQMVYWPLRVSSLR